jgi:gliding motility-associated-like protein
MKKLALLFSILFSVSLTAQVYVIEDQVTVNTCSGTFVDSGGEAATYSGNQSFTYTICPENAGQLVQLEFTAFATQTGADIMTIYNAADTLDPATSLGDFSGDAAADSPQTVIATVDNTSGCLTIVFTSNAGVNLDGWAANISCFEPCQEITAVLESSDPSPNAEGEIVICVGGTVDFEGSGVFSIDPTGATYSWSFGNDTNADGTNVTATYDTPGIYVVDLVVMDDNPIGCSNLNSISQVVRVAPEIEFTGTQAAQTQICYGESTTIEGVATIPQFDDCAPEIFDETWLEDTQSTGLGTSYNSTITVDCYGAGQLLTDVSQILDFCVNIEHSFIGDLDIYLIAPNGAEVYFLQYGDGVDPGTSLGIPDEADNGNPGTGWDYCFSPTATQSMNDVTGVNTIPEGTYAPLATSSFDNLLGTPLNGNWTFVVVDSWAFDDGTLFSWNLNFDPDIFPPSNIIVSETWDADSTIINTTDTTITVQPPTEGPFCYTFRAVDDFGCEYSTEVCVEVLPEFIYAAPNDLFVCNTGTTLGVFNLTENDAIISAPTPDPGDFEITYHESQADADADSNPITPTDAASYSGTDGQIIYVRFEYKTSGCFETISFTLNLLDQPLISAVTDMVECDDITNDGSHSFDFSDQTLDILGTQLPENYTVSYYTSFADADAGTNNLSNPYSNVSSPEPIYVRVEANGGAGCYIVDPDPVFNLVVNHKATASALSSIPTCDDDSDGIMTFDLEQQTTVVLGSQIASDFVVTYHETQSDADTNSNPLTSPYSNTTANQQTIFVRVEEIGLEACYETTQFELIVNPLPTTTTMSVLPICDDDTDGLGAFMLTSKDTEALGGQTGVTVSYHETQSDADTNASPLSSPYTNTTPSSQIIFIRLENNTTGCFSTMPLELRVNPIPTANSVSTQTICDDDYDGLATFNFTGIDLTVIGTQTGMVVSYHETQSDADTNTSAVTSPYTSITANAQTLFIRLENTTTGCFDTTTLELLVDPLPVIPSIIDYELCDYTNSGGLQAQFDLSTKDTEIIDGQNVSVAYFETETDATNNTNELTGTYQNTSTPQTLYVALTDLTTGCRATGSFELIVNPLPTTTTMSVLPICDDDTDGLGAFMLTSKDTEALGGQTGVTVSYHETQSDADTNASPLSSPYTNTTPSSQIIFIRLENNTTGCFSTMPLELRVNPIPTANSVSTQTICDDDYDGLATFNFTGIDLTVIGTQTGMVVSYHETQSDADTNTSAVTSPYTSITANAQTLFIRLENTTTGCFDTTTLELLVDPLPVIPSIIDYELCDYTNSGGLQAQFDLSTKDTEIIDGQNVSVAYFETETDATNNTNELTGTYQNTSTPQTLYVALTDLTTGCRATGSFELIVNPLPELVVPTVLEVCDDGTPDGLTQIDLTEKDDEIKGGNADYSITYYLTQADADSETNPLPIPYTNISNPQTVFARGQDINTGCYTTVALELNVSPAPLAITPQDLTYCDPDSDGFGAFMLTDRDFEISGGVSGVTISYHENLSDAENEINALSNPYTNVDINTQTVFARVENPAVSTLCASIVELVLVVNPTPQLLDPTPLEVCDDDTDEFAQFNLTTKEGEFLNGIADSDVDISYYETQADAQAETFEIATPTDYTNLSNPQTVWIRVAYNATGCEKLISLELIVNPLPVLVTPSTLRLCDDNAPGDEQEAFTLEDRETEILNGQIGLDFSYHLTALDAETNSSSLTSPYTNISNPQTIFVRVSNPVTGCFDLTTLTLEVLPIPSPQTPVDLNECDDNATGDGQEVFDLTTNEAFILNGELGVTPTYYETLADAEADTNPIQFPENYTNTDIPVQTIYVRVTNDTTDCFAIINFDVIVDPLPEANPVPTLIACELNTDGIYAFDLEVQSDEIRGTQSATEYDVTYYESLADATLAVNSLTSPYLNTSNPQTIYVNVTNTNTGCQNTAIEFNLEVLEAAQATSPTDPYTICDDNVETDNDPTNDSVLFDLSTQDAFVLNGQDPANYLVRYFASQNDADLDQFELPNFYENTVNPQVIFARVDNNTQIIDNTGTLVDSSVCYETAPLILKVNPLPYIDIDDEYVMCVNTNGTEVLGPLEITTGLSDSDYTFIWRDDSGTIVETASSYVPTEGGIYTLEVSDALLATQCAAPIEVFTVIESEPPTVTAVVTTQAFANTHIIEATATGIGDYEYNIDQGPWQDTGTFVGVNSGERVVNVRDLNGCGVGFAVVYVIDFPKYFTPNGDGYHDTWNIIGISNQLNAKIQIFDRYGKLLKEIRPSGDGWDGTYNGARLPSSDYWFVLSYNEPVTGAPTLLNAHFSLKR